MKSRLTAASVALFACSVAFAQGTTKPAHQPTATPAAAKPTAAQPGKDHAPPAMSETQMADMKACTEAGTPGPQHQFLAKGVGTWNDHVKMWMDPASTEPMESTATTVITSLMDGRFIKNETTGDMMGQPFHGFGINGYDNVAKKFQSTWIDSMGTTMMTGTGELSADSKVMTWNYNYTCPITKKPTTMRQVETWTGDNAMKLEMFGADPHTGKEFKMMEITCTRQPGTAAPATTTTPKSTKPTK